MPLPFKPAPGTDLLDLAWFPSPNLARRPCRVSPNMRTGTTRVTADSRSLLNYLRYTARRVLEQGKWLEASGPHGLKVSAFNTGLLSQHFEPIYAVFEENRNVDKQPRVHKGVGGSVLGSPAADWCIGA